MLNFYDDSMPQEAPASLKIVDRCRRIVSSSAFEPAVLTLILFNAMVLGFDTFESVSSRYHPAFELLYQIIFSGYVAELLIRFTAAGWSLSKFAEDRWNVFDFVVLAVVFIPGVHQKGLVLRLIRLVRIVRIVRFLPDLRVIAGAIAKSLRGMASLAAATGLLLFIYGMLGWSLFSAADASHYGNVGRAMLTLFVMLTLENLPENVAMGQQVSEWTILFFVSYALLMSLLIFNLFIGVVLGAMEEARAMDATEHETDDLLSRLRSARRALEQAETELSLTHRDDR